MSIYLSFFISKEACRISSPSHCLLSGSRMSRNNEFAIGAFLTRFGVLDIKPLMNTANLTHGEVIWLLFELVLIVIRNKTDKTAVTYKEVALNINLHFISRFI